MHNVRLERLQESKNKGAEDPGAVWLDVNLQGQWSADESKPQFAGTVKFPKGEVTFEADFPPFLGGDGRAPSPLIYCFYGAMSCYGATFATQAAMAGVELEGLSVSLKLGVDFRSSLGLGEFPPLSEFEFEVTATSQASDDDIQKVKALADERCPAIWAMTHQIAYKTSAKKA